MDKLLKNWDTKRLLFLLAGLFSIGMAVADRVWFIGIFGLYYVAMAVFRFGCVGGSCEVNFDQKKENSK